MHDARSMDRMKGEYRMKKKDRSVNFKKIAAVVIAFAVMLSMITIPEKTAYAASGTVKSITVTNVSDKQLTLKKGKTFTLKTKVKVTGKASKKVIYKTSDPKVVTVNSKGKITAKKNGKATITITSKADSKKKYKISVTVGTPVTSVKLSASSVPLITGKSMKV